MTVLVACGDNPGPEALLPELKHWPRTYLTYHASEGLLPCGGNFDYSDGYVPFLARELGLDAPMELHYLWLDTERFESSMCRGGPGCAIEEFSLSLMPIHLHEIAHSITYKNGMNRWWFFTEGLAVAYDPWFSDGVGPRYVLSSEGDPLLSNDDPMLLAEYPDFLHYGVAGAFVTFLLARHGPEKFVSLSQSLGGPRTMENLRARFRGVYGVELADEIDLFNAGLPCTGDLFPVIPYDCAMPTLAWSSPHEWRYSGALACEAGDVVGGLDEAGARPSLRSVTLDIEAPGTHQLALQSDGDVAVQIGPCFGCPWEFPDHILEPNDVFSVKLAAGRYYVRMRGNSDEVPNLEIQVAANPLGDL